MRWSTQEVDDGPGNSPGRDGSRELSIRKRRPRRKSIGVSSSVTNMTISRYVRGKRSMPDDHPKRKRLGNMRFTPCPKCRFRFWGYDHEHHRIVRTYHRRVGEKVEIIKDIARFRRVCQNCGYTGVWQYGLPFDIKRNQGVKVDA